jgi:hypothetical protein
MCLYDRVGSTFSSSSSSSDSPTESRITRSSISGPLPSSSDLYRRRSKAIANASFLARRERWKGNEKKLKFYHHNINPLAIIQRTLKISRQRPQMSATSRLYRNSLSLRTEGILRKIPKINHLPPNRLNKIKNANGTIWKLVSRASQWVPMLRGWGVLINF